MQSKRRYTGLICLNAVLLSALAAVTLIPDASAQRNNARRNRGEYTMVGGRVQGISESALWLVDSANQEMLVLRWNHSQKKLEPLGYRNLDADRANAGGRVR